MWSEYTDLKESTISGEVGCNTERYDKKKTRSVQKALFTKEEIKCERAL